MTIALSEYSLCSLDLFEDIGGFCGPDEGFRLPVVVVGELSDGFEQFLDIAKNTAPQAFFGQVAEEALDHIEPRTTCKSEVNVEPFAPVNPARHGGVFVCGVVVHDEVHLPVFRHQPVDDSKEAPPFL